jgi:hypothetical protein
MNNWKSFERNQSLPDRGNIPVFASRDWGSPRETSISMSCVPADVLPNHASNNSSVVACVFVTAVTFLPSRCPAGFLPISCLATIRGFLPSRWLTRIGTHTHTHTHTHTQQRDLINLLYFYLNFGKEGQRCPIKPVTCLQFRNWTLFIRLDNENEPSWKRRVLSWQYCF